MQPRPASAASGCSRLRPIGVLHRFSEVASRRQLADPGGSTVKRFIEHVELARDRRFIRQENLAADLMAKLPDDVDTVVELFEKISPIIETGARGTAAEPLFDRFGPAYLLMTIN